MNGKSIVISIVLLVLGVGAGYYFATNYKVTPVTEEVIETITPIPTPTQMITVVPSVDEKAAIIAAVRAGLIAEHGPGANAMTITVSKIQGNYAQGGASEQGGGAMWFAAKVSGAWKLAWDGNGTISCASIDPYKFPVTMIPECWNDTTQKLITR